MPNSGKEKQFIESRLLRPIQDRCLKIFNRSPSPRPISDTGLQDNVVRTSLSTSQNTSGTSAIQEPSVTTSSTATSSASDDHNLQYNEYTAIGGLPTTPPGPSTPGQRMKDGGGVAYEGLKAVAQALYNCSDMFLPLKAAVGVFLEVTKVVDRVSGNKKELADLQSKLEAILSIVQKYQRYGGLRALDHRIEIFCQAITAQSEAVRKLQAHHVSTRAAEGAKDADTILKALCNVNNLCDVLQIDTQLHIEVAVEDIGGNVEDIDGNVKEILQRLTSGTIDRLRHEMTSYKTRHSSYGDSSGCMLGTRIQILADLDTWASDEGSSKVYWMVGMAGTGKSTVSQTLCENLDKKNMLGASFFCSRASDKANNARLIIPAIAHSLAKTSPSVRSEVVKAIESDERLMESTYSNLKDQFEKLICQPIRKAIGQSIKTYKMIVIDAVDECTDLRLASSLIQLILSSVSDLPLKIFIASREETPIHNAFHSYPKVWTPLYLHEVKEDVIKHDIHQYLETSLSDIKNCFPGDNSNAWPSPSDISMLLDRCGTLFIYASTVIRYINDIDGNYWYRLSVMTSSSSKSASHLQTDPLYDLYGQILERANESKDPDEVCQISQLLSTVVFLQNPLTVQAIGSLLAMEISASLSPLRSVIHVSTNKQATVAPFHASFTDFITDPTHCSPKRCPSFAALVASEGHTMLALKCLQHMNCKLKYNICGVPDELTVSRREKRNLPENMSKISEALKYSCLYWASHLAKAEVFATELVTALDCFLRKHLLHWIECLSVLNELQTGLKCLGSASIALSGFKPTDGGPHEFLILLHDASRCLQMNFEVVEKHCFEIYHSALVWIPRTSLLCTVYAMDICQVPKHVVGLPDKWDPAELVIINSARVESSAFSPDRSRVVSGSWDDTVRIWNAMTGGVEFELKGHSGRVNSVAFSPDGTRVVSGSWDKTVRIWNAMTGEAEFKLKGHLGGVNSVAFSLDGTRVVSGSWDKTVWIWNAMTGEVGFELRGHLGGVNSVAFSLDGTQVVSGSWDNRVQIWNTGTGQSHIVTTPVIILPDSTKVLYNRFNYTISPFHIDYPTHQSSPLSIQCDWILGEHYDCWIPSQNRNFCVSAFSGNKVCLGHQSGHIVILDMTIRDTSNI